MLSTVELTPGCAGAGAGQSIPDPLLDELLVDPPIDEPLLVIPPAPAPLVALPLVAEEPPSSSPQAKNMAAISGSKAIPVFKLVRFILQFLRATRHLGRGSLGLFKEYLDRLARGRAQDHPVPLATPQMPNKAFVAGAAGSCGLLLALHYRKFQPLGAT